MSIAIDLSQLPAPNVIEAIAFEQINAEIQADLLALMPELADVLQLESEPITKLIEICSYREMLLRARINDAARALLLAYSAGTDLDHKAAEMNISRLVVTPANPDAVPPTLAIYENDDRLRLRVQMALESATVAGPEGSYIFQTLSASAYVRDVSVTSPVPGNVLVTILSTNADMQPDADLIATVQTHLSGKKVRPLSDTIIVQAAQIVDYIVTAVIHCYPGPSSAPVLEAAITALSAYTESTAKIGEDITLSGIYAALHQPGVKRVDLISPTADIVIGTTQAARCISANISIGASDV